MLSEALLFFQQDSSPRSQAPNYYTKYYKELKNAHPGSEFFDVVSTILQEYLEEATKSDELQKENFIRALNFFLFYYFQSSVKDSVTLFLPKILKAFIVTQDALKIAEDEDDDEDGDGVNYSSKFIEYLPFLHQLGWTKIYQQDIFQSILQIIEDKVRSICEDDDNQTKLKPILKWTNDVLKPFIKEITPVHSNHMEDYRITIERFTIEIFMKERIKYLFDMITDFPDSYSHLIELKECITNYNSDFISFIGKEMRKILTKRLLHLGATTSQILDFYVSMIKALRVIDTSDVLLNYVAIPIRNYLKQRKDTIRCIISSLTESKDSDIYYALKQGSSLAYGMIDEDDEENGPGEGWYPVKRNKELKDTSLNQASNNSKGLDILATLVSIYGSTELFIVEYRNLLAEKMISNLNYATDQEVANLELLKIRFGEESLHNCEVMLKDIEDSKRTNTAVHSALKTKATNESDSMLLNSYNLSDFVIISENYWPNVSKDHMVYHPLIQKMIETYHSSYMILKKPRKIHPMETLGYSELELEFKDGSSRTFSTNAIQANVILYIGQVSAETAESGDQTIVSLQDICTQSELDEEEVLNAIKFWMSKGVVKEIPASEMPEQPEELRDPYADPDRYFTIIEDQANRAAGDLNESSGNDDFDASAKSDEQDSLRQKKANKLVESYVKGLLSSHGSLSIDRLFSMLQLVIRAAVNDDATLSTRDTAFAAQIVTLRQFLQTMCEHGDLDIVDGLYSIKAK